MPARRARGTLDCRRQAGRPRPIDLEGNHERRTAQGDGLASPADAVPAAMAGPYLERTFVGPGCGWGPPGRKVGLPASVVHGIRRRARTAGRNGMNMRRRNTAEPRTAGLTSPRAPHLFPRHVRSVLGYGHCVRAVPGEGQSDVRPGERHQPGVRVRGLRTPGSSACSWCGGTMGCLASAAISVSSACGGCRSPGGCTDDWHPGGGLRRRGDHGRHGRPVPVLPVVRLLPALLAMLLIGPIEELGWRGVALPLLQRRFSPLWAGLILGLVVALARAVVPAQRDPAVRLVVLAVLLRRRGDHCRPHTDVQRCAGKPPRRVPLPRPGEQPGLARCTPGTCRCSSRPRSSWPW